MEKQSIKTSSPNNVSSNTKTIEEILNNLTNPFDFDGFIKLLNLLLNSRDWSTLYSSIVTKYQDRSMSGEPEYICSNDLTEFMTTSDMHPWSICEYFSDFFPTEHRIYINSSLTATTKIVKLFISECNKLNIPFHLKYINEATIRSDVIVIGGNSSVFLKQINILLQIAKEHPELIDECGTPHMLTSKLNSWVGIADENINRRFRSYSESRLGLIICACFKYLLRHNHPIEGYDSLIMKYKHFIDEANSLVKAKKMEKKDSESYISKKLTDELTNYAKSSLSKLDCDQFADIINNTPGSLHELYNIFLESCNDFGIDASNPLLYKGSKEDLLKAQNENKKTNINFEGKNFIAIINEYTLADLPTENKVQLIKEIENKMYEYLTLLCDSIDYKQLISNSNKKTPFESEFLSAISNTLDRGLLIKRGKSYKSKNELLFGEDENIANDQLQNKFTEKRKEISSFLKKSLSSKEEIKKCISILDSLYKKYNNIYIQGSVIESFARKKDFLQFELDHYEEISKYWQDYLITLQSTQYSTEALQKMYVNNMYRPTNTDFENQIGLPRIAYGQTAYNQAAYENDDEKDDEWYY